MGNLDMKSIVALVVAIGSAAYVFGFIASDVKTLNTDVTTLNTDVTTLNTDVTTLNTDVTTLNTDVTTLNTDVATLNTDVATLSSKYEGIGSPLTEDNVNNLIEDILQINPMHFKSLRIESGEISSFKGDKDVTENERDCLLNKESCTQGNERGLLGKRKSFKTEFSAKPKVLMALRYIDQSGNNELQVAGSVIHIDTKGFNYKVRTWGDTAIRDISVVWIAIGYEEHSQSIISSDNGNAVDG